MIKLFSQALLVRSPAGSLEVFETEQLRRDLATAFAACGNREEWLAEHVAFAVEERLLQEQEEGGEARDQETIVKLVLNILFNAGYADVAAEFGRRRGAAAVPRIPFSGEELLPWDEARVRSLLAERPEFSAAAATGTMAQVLARLKLLGFERVSNTLIMQTAAHLFFAPGKNAPDSQAGPPAGRDDPWLLAPPQAEALAATEFADIPGLVRLQPVSRLMPRVRVEVCLDRLAAGRCTPPVTELWLLPEFRRCCRRAAEIFGKARATVCARDPGVAVFPAYLHLRRLAELLAYCGIPNTAAAVRDLSAELAGIARDEIAADLGARLYITIK